MKRKRLLLFLGCLAALLLAGYVTLRLTPPRQWIMKEKFAAIKNGMTEKEVEGLLGVPEGIYRSSTQTGNICSMEWAGEYFVVWINFDETGRVYNKRGDFLDESFLDKLRRWLGM